MVVRNVEPQSPLWWLLRLHKKLDARQRDIERFDAYYRGDHPLPWLAPQAVDDFRRILKMTRSNYMGLVCDAQVERINLEGFRVGTNMEADKAMWDIWQANRLDSDLDQGLLEGAIAGDFYMLTAPNPKDQAKPFVWIEHPAQCIVEYVPGTGRNERAAGLKLWLDDWTGRLCATVYLPQGVYKYESESRQATASTKALGDIRWRPREVTGDPWGARNPLAVVPLVELPNNPRLLTGGVSELHDVVDVQDRVNKTIADRLMTQDYGAFPAKWASGWPEEDSEGRPTPKINVGRDRITTTDSETAKFGQWDAAPIDPYSAAKREDVKDIASRTRTPAQYLLGELSNVNGETLKASESGLVSKVRQRTRAVNEGIKDVAALMRLAAGLPPAQVDGIWRNPEFRTEGELVDALTKMSTLGVPEEALWERWGATPLERQRWKKWNEERRVDPTLLAMSKDITGQTGGNAPADQAAQDQNQPGV